MIGAIMCLVGDSKLCEENVAIVPESKADRSHLITVIAIAVIAYAACDMTHEVLGHGTAILFTPQMRAVSLTTVALSSYGSSRVVAAAGTLANLLAGLIGLLFLRLNKGSSTARYFLWLFASLNLLNATAYPVYSGILNFGDWQVVIAGLQPQAAWRTVLVIVGLASYAGAMVLAAVSLGRLVSRGDVPRRDLGRLVVTSYVAGGLLLVAGAAMNPIDPRLILLSGVSSGFGAMAGLLWVPGYADKSAADSSEPGVPLPVNWICVGTAFIVALVFVFVIGRGIRL